MSTPIPLIDLRAQYETIRGGIDAAVKRSIERSAFIGGEEHDLFQKEYAAYHHAKHCIGVANGTDAIVLALRSLGVGPGDLVLTTPFTFIATVEAITLNGAQPVFADIDAASFNISPESVERAIAALDAESRRRLKVLMPVHLYGRPADMEHLCDIAKRNGLAVLEDCAQAHGATFDGRRVGTFGSAGTFSFYPGKNLGAYGDAGAVITNDDKLAELIGKLRNHGRAEKYTHMIEGVNSRLDGIQAAVLRVKLERLDEWNAARRLFASLYNELLSGCGRMRLPVVSDGAVFHLYTIRHPERDRLRDHLATHKIATGVHYPIPLHLQPAYAHLGWREGAFPESEKAAREVLSLPLYPEMGEATVRYVAEKIREAEAL